MIDSCALLATAFRQKHIALHNGVREADEAGISLVQS